MTEQLPTIEFDGETYFVDERLGEIRNVSNPDDAESVSPELIDFWKSQHWLKKTGELPPRISVANEGYKPVYTYQGERLPIHLLAQEILKFSGCSIKEVEEGNETYTIMANCPETNRLLKR